MKSPVCIIPLQHINPFPHHDLPFQNCLVLELIMMVPLLTINFNCDIPTQPSFHSFLIQADRTNQNNLIFPLVCQLNFSQMFFFQFHWICQSQLCMMRILKLKALLSGWVDLLQSHFDLHFLIALSPVRPTILMTSIADTFLDYSRQNHICH